MTQALIGALLGLPVGASEDDVVDRAREVSAFMGEAVRLSGEAEPSRALGALRAHVERSKRAGEIEAKARDSHIAASLGAALADPRRITPAEVEDLKSFGERLGPEALDAYLAKRAPMAPPVFTEPAPPAGGGGPSEAAGPPDLDSFKAMTISERARVRSAHPEAYKRLSAAMKVA